MKKLLFPKSIGRVEFFYFSVIITFIGLFCFFIDKKSIIVGYLLVAPFYWIYGVARVRDWNGVLSFWAILLGIFLLMFASGVSDQINLFSQMPQGLEALNDRLSASLSGKKYLPTPQGYVSDNLELYLMLFVVIHTWLQIKRGNTESKSYVNVRSNLQERLKIFALTRQKNNLIRKQKIEKLKEEIEQLNKTDGEAL